MGPAKNWIDVGMCAFNASLSGLKLNQSDLAKLNTLMAEIETERLADNHQPYAFASKKTSDPNLPSLKASLSGDEAHFYWEAMEKEVRELEQRKTWVYVDRDTLPEGTYVVPTLWAQRKKVTPSGEFRKYKSRITCRGDLMKKHGIEPKDTYAPVCSWNSVRLVLTLSLLLGLKTESLDFSNAFVQADLPEDQQIYIDVPLGFQSPKPNQVLKLKKSLYGTASAPLRWYEKCDKGLRARGFKRSRFDPCLYVSKHMLICLFVDDLVLVSNKQKHIDDFIQTLVEDGDEYNWEHTREGDLAEFLGIELKRSPDRKSFQLLQTGLIDKILKLVDPDGTLGTKNTPMSSDGKPLVNDKNGLPYKGKWDYRSVVGSLMYLATNSRPDLAHAVHSAARFNHDPKESHGIAVLRICKYLKKTRTQGMIISPTETMNLDLYVDSDYAGMFSTEDKMDSISVKSRTGFVITLAGCPISWKSALQQEICLSSTEAEVVALSQALRVFVPLREHLLFVCNTFELSRGAKINVTAKSQIWEDNSACLHLARTKRLSPRTRHIAAKHWWSIQQIKGDGKKGNGICIEKIDGKENPADIFTKKH